jgi:exodeoxyribonuclease VII large subunit
LRRTIRERLREDRSLLEALRVRVGDPRYLVAEKQQALDELSFRLERRARQLLREDRARLVRVEQRLTSRHPRAVVQGLWASLHPLELRLRHALSSRLVRHRQSIARQHARLDALSPLSVLGRGYAIVIDAQGHAVKDSRQLTAADDVTLRLHRGRAQARVVRTEHEPSGGDER